MEIVQLSSNYIQMLLPWKSTSENPIFIRDSPGMHPSPSSLEMRTVQYLKSSTKAHLLSLVLFQRIHVQDTYPAFTMEIKGMSVNLPFFMDPMGWEQWAIPAVIWKMSKKMCGSNSWCFFWQERLTLPHFDVYLATSLPCKIQCRILTWWFQGWTYQLMKLEWSNLPRLV